MHITYQSFSEFDYKACENILLKLIEESKPEDESCIDLYHHLQLNITNYNKRMLYYIYIIFTSWSIEKIAKEFDNETLATPNLITSKLKEIYFREMKDGQIFNQ